MAVIACSRSTVRVAVAAGAVALASMTAVAPITSAEAQTAEPWETVTLRPLAGHDDTYVRDVNNDGTSVGSSGGAANTPVRWTPAGAPTPLAVPTGCTGSASAINEDGLVLGFLNCTGSPVGRSQLWKPDGTPIPMDGVRGQDVSDGGWVPGSRDRGDATARAMVWASPSGPVLDLEDGTGSQSVARAMTTYGYTVGDVAFGSVNPKRFAVGWLGPHVFPLLGTAVESVGVDVIESGWALVQVITPPHQAGYLVGPRGVVVPLDDTGLLDEVYDLNEHGIVLGSRSSDTGGQLGGFYAWDTFIRLDGLAAPDDVETYGFALPRALNDHAWVVGNSGDSASWLLRPPSS